MRAFPKLSALLTASALLLVAAGAVHAAPPVAAGQPGFAPGAPFPVGGGEPGGPPQGTGGGPPTFLTSDSVVGSGTWTDFGTPVAADVDATSDRDGANPSGTVVFTATFLDGVRTLHGDVSQGCMIVEGDVALVVGRIPAEEQWFTPGFGTVEYAAVLVEDNGSGSPSPDLALARALRPSSKDAACAQGPSWFGAQTRNALESGEFTVIDN